MPEISLWKRARRRTETKALAKSTVAKFVRELDLGLLNSSEMDCTNLRPLQHGSEVSDHVGLGQNRCWPVRGPQISRALSYASSALDAELENSNLCN